MHVTNSLEGQKPLAFKLKVVYKAGGTPKEAIKVINFQ
jgi:hypothetical protein